jgi:hypothetical protein
MNDDLLRRATEALRDEGGEPNRRSGETRARLLDSAEKRYRGGRRWLLRWSLAIASMFVVGTALARVAEYWPVVREALSLAPHAPDANPKPRKPAARRAPKPPAPDAVSSPEPAPPAPAAQEPTELAPAVQEPAQIAPAVQEPAQIAPAAREPALPHTPTRPAVRATRPRQPVAREPAAPASDATQPESSATPEPESVATPEPPARRSAELDLFRRALALHTAHDPAALPAWDAYLRVAERGVLVPEARYNRALCLVRLGRRAEARAALQPFARGEFGGYRRAEAEALLRALAQ